ncbi:MAG: hypothetical protein AB7Q23_15535 [Hyphomonadaceae bacterium]
MSAADRTAHAIDADFQEIGEQRRADRRQSDRRIGRMTLDPLFAATLVNHVAPRETAAMRGYQPPAKLRAGIAFDVKA